MNATTASKSTRRPRSVTSKTIALDLEREAKRLEREAQQLQSRAAYLRGVAEKLRTRP